MPSVRVQSELLQRCTPTGALADLINDRTTRTMSLVEHARRELEIIGEDPDTINGIVHVVQAFADCGHSGGSTPYAIAYLERLLRFEPLSAITDDPDEWVDRSEISGYPLWQNIRDSRAMSKDAGKTYWMVHEVEEASGIPSSALPPIRAATERSAHPSSSAHDPLRQ